MQNKQHTIISCNVAAVFVTVACFMFLVSIYFDSIFVWYANTSLAIGVITDLLFLALLVLIGCVVGASIFVCIRKLIVLAIVEKRVLEAILGKPRLPKRLIRVLAAVASISFTFFWFLSWRSVMPGDDWPRGFPYPDDFLLWMHRSIDEARPAGPGRIKIEGEWPIIRYSLSLGTLISLIVAVGSLLLLNWNRLIRLIYAMREYDKRMSALKSDSQKSSSTTGGNQKA